MYEVLIIPGHGGKDPGGHGVNPTTGGVMTEAKINLNVARRLRDKLDDTKRVNVTMSRVNDTYVSPSDQLRLCNTKKWDAIIAVHHNMSGVGAKGFEILHNDNGPSEALADLIAVQFRALNPKPHGAKDGTFNSPRNLALEKHERSPLVITEFCFLDSSDIIKIDTLLEQWAEANAIAYATLQFLGVL